MPEYIPVTSENRQPSPVVAPIARSRASFVMGVVLALLIHGFGLKWMMEGPSALLPFPVYSAILAVLILVSSGILFGFSLIVRIGLLRIWRRYIASFFFGVWAGAIGGAGLSVVAVIGLILLSHV